MRKIQSKILYVVIAALVVITALVTAIAVSITHKIIHEDADRILKNVSQKEAAYINDMLSDIEESSAIMEHYSASELSSTDDLMDEDYLASYLKKIKHLYDEVAINTSGISSYYLCFAPNLTPVNTGFYTKLLSDGSEYELMPEEFENLSLFESSELIEYMGYEGGGEGTWTDPHPSRFTGEKVVSYLAPIYKEDVFVGILGFNMDFNYLVELVDTISVYEYGYALLRGKDDYYNSYKITGVLSEYASESTALINGMNLELRADYKDIQHNIRPMLSNIIGAFILVFFAAIIYTVWVTNRIVTPLKKLTAAASEISSGVQDVDLIVDSDDEIGVLSHVLNDTYAKIREYSEYINALAYRDSLTGIKNSTAYSEAIAELNKEINFGNPVFGVIVADMNNLKKTNDTYGHDVGNELIIHSAKILTDTFRTSSVYRIGGDEFVVILKGKDLEHCRALMDRLDTALDSDYITVYDEKVPVSIAIGYARFNPAVDKVYTDVFEKADRAMYMNKAKMKAVRV